MSISWGAMIALMLTQVTEPLPIRIDRWEITLLTSTLRCYRHFQSEDDSIIRALNGHYQSIEDHLRERQNPEINARMYEFEQLRWGEQHEGRYENVYEKVLAALNRPVGEYQEQISVGLVALLH